MKEDYLRKLEDELSMKNVNNVEEIVNKYSKRYDFGLEAELSEEKIEEMLGDPKDIAQKYYDENKKEDYDFSSNEAKIGKNLYVKTLSANIIIKDSLDEEVHTIYDNIDLDCYEIKINEEEGIFIAFKKKKYFSLNRKSNGSITIELPQNINFNKIVVASTSGNISFNNLKATTAELRVVSSELTFSSLSADRVWVHTVSGDVKGQTIYTKEIDFNSVSGDIEINKVSADEIRIDTVSGDVKLNNSIGTVKSTSITGKIIIDGVESQNVKSFIKGVFK